MTIFDNISAFGLMPEALQAEMQAWPHGWLHYTVDGRWISWSPTWSVSCIYRAKPAPLTKPSVDWNILSDNIAGIARDSDGDVCAYEATPQLHSLAWVSDSAAWRIDNLLHSVTPGNCDWRESWVDNPRYKP